MILGAARSPEWTPNPIECNGRRWAARPPELRKTPGGAATEWGGGVELPQDDLTPNVGGGGLSHGRITRLKKQTEGESINYGMTLPPERLGAPRESKPWEPPQRPNPDGGRTDMGGGKGKKTHPPPDPTGSSRPMAETERCHRAQQRWRTRRRRWRQGWRSKPAARGACQHTPQARLWPRRREDQ